MADRETPVNLGALDGRPWARRWCYRPPDALIQAVKMGQLPDGRWWVTASWIRICGWTYPTEHAAQAQALRLREQQRAHPGEWQLERRNAVAAP